MELLAAAGLVKRGDVHLLIRFDEFSLNAEISYSGQKFRIPDRRPDFAQIPDDPEIALPNATDLYAFRTLRIFDVNGKPYSRAKWFSRSSGSVVSAFPRS